MPTINGFFYKFISKTSMTSGMKVFLLRKAGNRIGIDATIKHGVRFDSKNISIGDRVLLNYNVQLIANYGEAHITIGDDVQIGPGTLVCTSTHEIGNETARAGNRLYKDVSIGIGSWIGANVTILPGVNIGRGCVIGAGALVNKSTEPNGLYVGVPAKRIRDL